MPVGHMRAASSFVDRTCFGLTEYQQDVLHDIHQDKSPNAMKRHYIRLSTYDSASLYTSTRFISPLQTITDTLIN